MNLPFKAIVIIKRGGYGSDSSHAVSSHLLEYPTKEACEIAVQAVGSWGGSYEVIRLY